LRCGKGSETTATIPRVRLDNPDLETAFQTAVKAHVSALITITTAPLFLKQKQIVDLAVKNRLPTMFSRQHMLRQMATADNAASFAADTAGKKRSLQYRQPPALNPFRGIIPRTLAQSRIRLLPVDAFVPPLIKQS